MKDVIFYNDGRDADKRLFIEWPKGSKTDILTKEGKYLFSCNRTPDYIGVFCLANGIPQNVLIVECKPDTRDEKDFLAKRPGRFLLEEKVRAMLSGTLRKIERKLDKPKKKPRPAPTP